MKLDIYSKVLELIKISYAAQEYYVHDINKQYKPAQSKKLFQEISDNFFQLVIEIDNGLSTELDVNLIEGHEAVTRYCEGIVDKLNEEYNKIILTIKQLELDKTLPDLLEEYVSRFAFEAFNFRTNVRIDRDELLYLVAGKLDHILLDVTGWQSRNFDSSVSFDKATTFLYIEFSGLRKQMEVIISSSSIKYTKIQLAKMIGQITTNKFTYYQTLLTQVDWFYNATPGQPFTADMVNAAILLLRKDGFNTTLLESLYTLNFHSKQVTSKN